MFIFISCVGKVEMGIANEARHALSSFHVFPSVLLGRTRPGPSGRSACPSVGPAGSSGSPAGALYWLAGPCNGWSDYGAG